MRAFFHALAGAEDAHFIEHHFLHRGGNVEGVILAVGVANALELGTGKFGRVGRQGLERSRFGELGSAQPGMLSEDHQVEQRVGAEPVGSMDRDAGALPGGIQAGDDGILFIQDGFTVFVGRDAAHGIMRSRLDGHQLGDRVHAQVDTAEVHDIRQFRQDLLAGNRVRRTVLVLAPVKRGIFIDAFGPHIQVNIVLAVGAVAVADFHVDGAADHVTRGQVFDTWGRIFP